MIPLESIFDAVRRDYKDLQNQSVSEIIDYFNSIDPDDAIGHISNIKGIVFEYEVINALNDQGLNAEMCEKVNHPVIDITIFDDYDEVEGVFQLKATDSVNYIVDTLEANPDIPIITTQEVASYFVDNQMVLNSGLDNEALTEAVSETLFEGYNVNNDIGLEALSDSVSDSLAESLSDGFLPIPISPVGLVLSVIGLGLGLFF